MLYFLLALASIAATAAASSSRAAIKEHPFSRLSRAANKLAQQEKTAGNVLASRVGGLFGASFNNGSEPFPRVCAGGGDGSHSAMLNAVVSNNDLGRVEFGAWANNGFALRDIQSGAFSGFTSSCPMAGTIYALFPSGTDVLGASVEDSVLGFSALRADASSPYVMSVWSATGCAQYPLPASYSPSLACVGEGTLWSEDPTSGEVFGFGSGAFPILDFTHASRTSDYTATKRVDYSQGYAFLEFGGSEELGLAWQIALVNATTSPDPAAFALPARCTSF